MIKQLLILSLLMTGAAAAYGQQCPLYDEAMKLGQSYLNATDYDDALKQFQVAQTAAKQCNLNQALADKADSKLNDVIAGIKKQRDDYKAATETSLRYLKQFFDLTTKLTQLVQDDANNNIVGLAPLRTNLLGVVISAQKFISENSSLGNAEEMANAHLQLASSYQDLGNTKSAIAEYKVAYNASKKILDARKKNYSDNILNIYLRSVEAYSRDLMRKGRESDLDSASLLLNEGKAVIAEANVSTAACYNSLARFENAYARFWDGKNDTIALKSKRNAIAYARQAIAMDKNNTSYYKSLMTYLSNMVTVQGIKEFNADSVARYRDEVCSLAGDMSNLSGSGDQFVDFTIDCVQRKIQELVDKQDYPNALETLENTISRLDVFVTLDPIQKKLRLRRSELYLKMAELYQSNTPDQKGNAKSCLNKAIYDWMASINDPNSLPEDLYLLEDVYKKISDNIRRVFEESECVQLETQMLSSVGATEEQLSEYPNIAYIIGSLNLRHAEALINDPKKTDSAAAFVYCKRSIAELANAKILNKSAGYSEDCSKVCSAYYLLLALAKAQNDRVSMDAAYQRIKDDYMPLYNSKLYSYDWDLGWAITKANKLYGEFLYSKGEYQKAVDPLEFASSHGMKTATEYLIRIFNAGLAKNAADKSLYYKRSKGQHDDGKTDYKIPAEVNGERRMVEVHIVDRAENYPYKGIEDQASWYRDVKKVILNKAYVEAFNKYQQIAWERDQSFRALSGNALEEANNSLNVLNKYEKYKAVIDSEKDINQKINRFEPLIAAYENDLLRDSAHVDIIKTDAIPWYLRYVKLASDINRPSADSVCKRILELDKDNSEARFLQARFFYDQNKNEIKNPVKSKKLDHNDVFDFKAFLSFYLQESDYEGADMMVKKILNKQNNAAVRDSISNIYLAHTNYDDFDKLFLSNKHRVKEFWEYFNKKDMNKDFSNDYKRNHFFKLIKLDELYTKTYPQDSATIKKDMSQHYNNYAWYCMLTKKDNNIFLNINKSLELDPTNKYAIANKANAYLLVTNDLKDAKDIYTRYEDRPFERNTRFPTYRDFFLSNLADLEKAGVENGLISAAMKSLIKNDTGEHKLSSD